MIALTELPNDLLPAAVYDQLIEDMGFDPFAHQPLFDPPAIATAIYEAPWSMRAAIEIASNTDYTTWTTSDAAALLTFLLKDEDTNADA